MKYAISPEKQGVVTGSSEEANHPWSNLIDNDVRKKVGKAEDGVQTVTLRQAIGYPAKALTLHKTNAVTAIVTITLDSGEKDFLDGNPAVNAGGGLVEIPCSGNGIVEGDVVLINGTDNYDGVHTLPSQAGVADPVNNFDITATFVAENFSNTDTVCKVVKTTTHTLITATRIIDRFWEEYTEQAANHTATTKLTAAAGETIEAGILRAGGLREIGDPLSDTGEGLFDYSEEEPLHSGANYVVDLDVVRTFSYSLFIPRAVEFRDLQDLYRAYKKNSFAMLIADLPGNDNEYCVFGRFLSEPQGIGDHPVNTSVSISIREAV